MAYNATVIPVMIASPGDVADEREIIRKTLIEWNDTNTHSKHVVLMPVLWETRAAPDLAGRPQSIINERLLRDCDLLVAVFWTRFGTSTGEHASGTVEEIKQHVEAGKTAMIYFSNTPIMPGSYCQDQFKKVQDFKDWCFERGLVRQFDNQIDFERSLQKDLAVNLSDSPYLRAIVDVGQSTLGGATQSRAIVSPEAADMLAKAAESENGLILMVAHMNGTNFRAGEYTIAHDNSSRQIARLKAAVEVLEELDLIRARGYKREIFEVTDLGYEAADELKLKWQEQE